MIFLQILLTPRQCDRRLERDRCRRHAAPIAEGRDNERIDTDEVKSRLHGLAIGGIADKPLPDNRIGQRGDRCAAIDPGDDLLEVVERKTIAALLTIPEGGPVTTIALVTESMRQV
jgi:hypothetical protein